MRRHRIWFKGMDGFPSEMVNPKEVVEINFEDSCVSVANGDNKRMRLHFDLVTFMETTGISDINNQEIFDLDIIKFTSLNPQLNGIYVIRRASSGEWRIDNSRMGRSLYLSKNNVEVIGNYFETPDLLEEIDFEPYI